MNKVTLMIIWTSFCISASFGGNKPLHKKLPQPCIEPRHDQANNCLNQESFRYIKGNNTCIPIKDKHCRGHNRFKMHEECIWRCSDSHLDQDKVSKVSKPEPDRVLIIVPKDKTVESTTKRLPGPERMMIIVPKVPSIEQDRVMIIGPKESTSKGLDSSCKDRPTDCFKTTKAYRWDSETKECLEIVDNNCRGANRFTQKEECEFVCKYNKGEVKSHAKGK